MKMVVTHKRIQKEYEDYVAVACKPKKDYRTWCDLMVWRDTHYWWKNVTCKNCLKHKKVKK